MKKSLFFEKLENQDVRCQTCAHYCVRQAGQTGICGVRENVDGVMNVSNYGAIISRAVDPIEKKPFFHFLPCSSSFSIAAPGCNFQCGHCQNWQISQVKNGIPCATQEVPPQIIVEDAKKEGCDSIAYTYTEPTIFTEYALDVMKIAQESELKNCWVSNGYMSEQTREAIIPYLNAINIDLKAGTDKFYQDTCKAKLQPVLDNIVALKKAGAWVELTTLIIPTLNDSPTELKKVADFINEVDPAIPWHISRFSPEISYQMTSLPATATETIEQAAKIGKQVGLKYVYAGNIPGHEAANTYCPKCQELIIRRTGFTCELPHGKVTTCLKCQTKLDIIWK
ncbi:AmmeMemoRadiSam system radical SAM enzyme [Patescibacteria group bacterium]